MVAAMHDSMADKLGKRFWRTVWHITERSLKMRIISYANIYVYVQVYLVK